MRMTSTETWCLCSARWKEQVPFKYRSVIVMRFTNTWRWIPEAIAPNCVGARIIIFLDNIFNFSKAFLSYRHTPPLVSAVFNFLGLNCSTASPAAPAFSVPSSFLHNSFSVLFLLFYSFLWTSYSSVSATFHLLVTEQSLCVSQVLFSLTVLFYTEPSGVTERHPENTEVYKTWRQR